MSLTGFLKILANFFYCPKADFVTSLDRLKPFKDTLMVISTTEGDRENQKAPITTKICRVLDVLRQYVSEWPFPRSPGDAVPLNQSWRGMQKTFIVQLQTKNIEVQLHSNSTIGQLAEAVKIKARITNPGTFYQKFTPVKIKIFHPDKRRI